MKTKIKIPKTLGACADQPHKLRAQRYELQHQVKAIEEQERAIDKLPVSDASGISGKLATASVVAHEVPTADDWEKITAYVKKTGAFELLQKRLSPPAIRERWESGEVVPGIGKIVVKKVSVTKL